MSAQADAANEAAAPRASAAAWEEEGTAAQPSSPTPASMPAVSGMLTEGQELRRAIVESLRLPQAAEKEGGRNEAEQRPAAVMSDEDVGAVGAPANTDVSPPVRAPAVSVPPSRLPSYQDLLDRKVLANGDRVFCTQRKGKRFFGDLLNDGRIRYSSKCVLVSVGVHPRNGGRLCTGVSFMFVRARSLLPPQLQTKHALKHPKANAGVGGRLLSVAVCFQQLLWQTRRPEL
jgi:hypothetical protein